jgi:asparagine synthase (glutamine-hydrolysing)
MSVQFGICNFDGKPIDPVDLDEVRPLLAPYGPDGESYICKDNIAIIYRAFHTTKESRWEKQPYASASGALITWDGRLDNRQDLIVALGSEASSDLTDISIVAAAYEHWGIDAFGKLIGDWAISICDPTNRSLFLAKDFIGARHLYYRIDNNQVTWSTVLDPLVLCLKRPVALEEEYIAGWLSFFPASHLTPYVGIRAVPPCSFVRLTASTQTTSRYWDFDPAKTIRYRSDAEYEEHFRVAFSESVRRRLRSDSPTLAELSGGMDSSSIVCMADLILADGLAETPRVDTISYYNDSESNWNERPFFTSVEKARGRVGCHVDVSSLEAYKAEFPDKHFATTPASGGHSTQIAERLSACMNSQGNRVLLSGIGGDEVMGGVPSPTPELADLLARAHIWSLGHALKIWSLNKRVPWFHLLFEAVRGFLPPFLFGTPASKCPAPWLNPDFVSRHRPVFAGYNPRSSLFGASPSFQENLATLEMLRRQLACFGSSPQPCYEKRYPCLDRTLLEYLFAIPREQLVRPGQRRSLMRRALTGIVPEPILSRKRKAFVSRAPIVAMSSRAASLVATIPTMVLCNRQIVDACRFKESVSRAGHDQETSMVAVMRTVILESWLRHVAGRLLIGDPKAPVYKGDRNVWSRPIQAG